MLLGAKVTILIYHILYRCQLFTRVRAGGWWGLLDKTVWELVGTIQKGVYWTKQHQGATEMSNRRVLLDKTAHGSTGKVQ
jgi:hypothetical protein